MTSPPSRETGCYNCGQDGCLVSCGCVCHRGANQPVARETGPTPEEQAREIIAAIDVAGGTAAFSQEYVDTPGPHTVVLDAEIAALIPILTRLVSDAKRSAHLEDARAICAMCDNPTCWGPAFRTESEIWQHRTLPDYFMAIRDCHAPEVWDVLSLLGGK
jgi:hypothetical protein